MSRIPFSFENLTFFSVKSLKSEKAFNPGKQILKTAMDETYSDLMHFLKKPSFAETFVDIILCAVPIWLAVMIGLLIGWSWRPRWTGLIYLGFRSKLRFLWTAPPGFGARRLWLAFTALSAFSVCRTIWSRLDKSAAGSSASSQTPELVEESLQSDDTGLVSSYVFKNVTVSWKRLGAMSLSRTVFEDATPDIVRDFFWDDEFRPKWDFMLANFKTLEEDTQTGTMIVQWRKKFPFFCSDREYIIGRRIWESGNKYYCVTKGIPYPALPKRDKPRRVEVYFSSWVIRAVESRKGDGQQTACEVSLVHYEDMGIPKDVAKLGVRHGMWGAVKKLNSGLRAYQAARKPPGSSLSRIAQMARITTRLNLDSTETSTEDEDRSRAMDYARRQRDNLRMDWKWFVVGGVALACGIHTGIIGKALLAGAGQRLARR
ncbi:unnamed protein product [Thlaspi arvense]|uniref:START domain-containing protein n=1 Tax=Thlaspi arvense TaxID=13288 RepID=A0AAU9T8E8_THLAR|nr:unnamed protein product [Thlaspi arvense]